MDEINCLYSTIVCNKYQSKSLFDRFYRLSGVDDSTRCNELFRSLLRVLILFAKFQSTSYIINNWMNNNDSVEFDSIHLELDALEQLPSGADRLTFENDKCADEEVIRNIITQDLKDHDSLKASEARVVSKEIETAFEFLSTWDKNLDNVALNCIDPCSVEIDPIPLGVGGFGKAYKGRLRGIEVAVKKLKTINEEHTINLRRETTLLHINALPGVLRCFGVDNIDNPTMIVMEVAYCSLDDIIYKPETRILYKQWNQDRKLYILTECCTIFAFLHSVGVIHRDIKPGNILIMHDGHIKVSDFGLATTQSNSRIVLNSSSTFAIAEESQCLGTAEYMAPELLMCTSDKFEYSEATDMYAFAITMNEMFVEKKPFEGNKSLIEMTMLMYQTKGTARPHDHISLFEPFWDLDVSKRLSFYKLNNKIQEVFNFNLNSDCDSSNNYIVSVDNVFIASSVHTGYYSGQIRLSGKRNGKGTFKSVRGYTYEGEWNDDMFFGQGKWVGSNGDTYEGHYWYGQRSGHGISTDSNGVYDGNWIHDKKCRSGIFTYKDGSVYDGEWNQNEYHGKGKLVDKSGAYDGQWKKGVRHGFGKFILPNGGTYEGEWMNGMCSGKGKFVNSVGSYDGEWLNDKKHGYGILTHASCGSHEGNWVEGKKTGFGKSVYTDGSTYEGEWVNNRREGQGKLVFCEGHCCEGTWKNDELLNAL